MRTQRAYTRTNGVQRYKLNSENRTFHNKNWQKNGELTFFANLSVTENHAVALFVNYQTPL